MKRVLGLLVLAACAGLVAGCGTPTGSISGTVRYKGAPVPGGRISFLGVDGRALGADLGEDGSYTVLGVPVGPAKVSVDNKVLLYLKQMASAKRPGAQPRDKVQPGLGMRTMVGRYVPLPPNAADFDKSGIVCEVENGSQSFPVELK